MQLYFNPKLAVAAIVIFLGLYIGLCAFLRHTFTYWIPICVLVTLLGLFRLVRALGIFLMYPGSFTMTQAKFCLQEGKKLYESNYQWLSVLYSLLDNIIKSSLKQLPQIIDNRLLRQSLTYQINLNIDILKCSKQTNTKQQLKYLFENLKSSLNSKRYSGFSITELIDNTNHIQCINQSQFNKMQNDATQFLINIQKICEITEKLMSPYTINKNSQTLRASETTKWLLWGEKLFDMSSYYAYWNLHLEYTQFIVHVLDNYQLECAIVHAKKGGQPLGKQAVIFCCPNAMFMQDSALGCCQVEFYLNEGFQVVLWNYRGYGQSTGHINLFNCMSDIVQVYEHCMKNYEIEIVIAHGYSIGGACAIELGTQYPDALKLIISDRSFCSIPSIASSYIPTHNFLYRKLKDSTNFIVYFFFYSECMDLSHKFQALSSRKVIIWDLYDDIVRNNASIKQGIFKNLAIDSYCNKKKYDKIDKDEVESLIALKVLREAYIGRLKDNLNIFMSNMRILRQRNQQQYKEVLNRLRHIDGAGIKINRNATETKSINENLRSFYLGLACYGQNTAEFYVDNPINQFLTYLQDIDKNDHETTVPKNRIADSLKAAMNIYETEVVKEVVGELIITDVGHNGPMNRHQFQQLRNIIGSALNKNKISL